KIIRVALVVGVVNQVLTFANRGSVSPDLRTILSAITLLTGVVGLIGQFAQLYYLKNLALRFPDHLLAARAHFLMWAIGISYGILIVFGGVIALLGPSPARGAGGGVMVLFGCVSMIDGLALIVFALMYLSMLIKF